MKFEFDNPTRVIFGAGSLERLGAEARKVGRRALLVTGGGSVKKSGAFDRAVKSIAAASLSFIELSGVEPNPRLTTVVRGAEAVRRFKCDFVIALGGGSVMDAAKVIAAAVYYQGDAWDMIAHGQAEQRLPTRALPVVTVPTVAATGSEMNDGAVITNTATTEKSYVLAHCLLPRLAIIDPSLTLSVPRAQTAYGIADLLTHVTEGYFNGAGGTPLQDRFAEATVLTAMEHGARAVADGSDLEARAQVQWASTVALNGWLQLGGNAPFPVHMIEHVLSAHHDVAHGAGLAVVSPGWMRFAAGAQPAKFVQFAERVFALKGRGPDDLSVALEGIGRFEKFLLSIGCPARLSQLGIGDEKFATYARDTLRIAHDRDGRLGGRPPMTEEDVAKVLRSVA